MSNQNPMGMVVEGPDTHCPKCGQLLVHINEAGEPEGQDECSGFTIGGQFQPDGPPVGKVVDAECEKCNPELKEQHPFARLGPVAQEIAKLIQQRRPPDPQETPDQRIKLPWE